MFHITFDIEATVEREAGTTRDDTTKRYHQVLVQALLTHPKILHQLLRSTAITELRNSRKVLETEYNREGTSEQDLLKAVFEELEPEVQAYFTEEIEDHQRLYLFDGSAATIKRFQMTESPLQTKSSLD